MCILCSSVMGDDISGASSDAMRRSRRRVMNAPVLSRSGPILIEPSWVLLCDENDELSLVRDHTVVVENDVITEVLPRRRAGRDRPVQAPGTILLPGFISGHTHVAGGTVTRGIIEGGRNYGRPLELAERLDDADLEAVTAHNLAELLRSGCTTQVEMSMSLRQVQAYVRVASHWGVRGYPSTMVPGIERLFEIWRRSDDQVLFDSVPASLGEIEQALGFGRKVNGSENGRIQSQMGVHATDTQTPETMQAFAAAAQELGNGIHMHLSQGPAETETVRQLWGKRPAQWIDDFDFYDGPLFAAVTGLLVGSGAVPPEPLNNLLYAHGRCVRDVMIDGQFMVRKGSPVVDDEHRVVRDGRDAVTKIWDELRAEGWFDL